MKATARQLLLTASLLVLVLAAGYGIIRTSLSSRDEVHAQAIETLEQAPVARVLPTLRAMTTESGDSTALLTACLSSSSHALIDAADTLLTQQLIEWRGLPRQQAQQRVQRLVVAITSQVPRMPGNGRRAARLLIHEAMRWPPVPGSRDSSALLISSQQALATLNQAERAAQQQAPPPAARLAKSPAEAEETDSLSPPRTLPSRQREGGRSIR